MLRTREETMKFVEMEIQRIKADWHIEDLMEHKCVDEVSQLICDESHFLFCTPLSEYTKIDKLLLRDEEIREENFWEVVFLVYCAYIPNALAFEDMSTFKKIAEKKGKGYLVSLLKRTNLCELTVEELLGVV